VTVPDLAEGASALASGAPVPTSDPAKYGAAQRGVGIGVGVLGVVAVAAGSVFGLKAGSDWDAAKSHCTSYPHGCDAQAVSLAEDAHAASNTSTVAFVIGGAALAGGAVLFFTAPQDPSAEKTLSIRILPAAIALSGRF
jgi:serine/threonine-protein kinase